MPHPGRKGALPDESNSTAWERRVGRHRERRQEEDDLLSRLDDLLVHATGEFPQAANGSLPPSRAPAADTASRAARPC
jgi:hypothetical protein